MSIRLNGSAGQRSICLLSSTIAQRTGINKSVSFAGWQQGAGFVVPHTAACYYYYYLHVIPKKATAAAVTSTIISTVSRLFFDEVSHFYGVEYCVLTAEVNMKPTADQDDVTDDKSIIQRIDPQLTIATDDGVNFNDDWEQHVDELVSWTTTLNI